VPQSAGECAEAIEGEALAPAAAAAADQRVPVSESVDIVARWLRTGEAPERYRRAAEERTHALATAIASGALRLQPLVAGRVATVVGEADGVSAICARRS
jgi:hypothetical protein